MGLKTPNYAQQFFAVQYTGSNSADVLDFIGDAPEGGYPRLVFVNEDSTRLFLGFDPNPYGLPPVEVKPTEWLVGGPQRSAEDTQVETYDLRVVPDNQFMIEYRPL